KATLSVLKPDDPRLRVTGPEEAAPMIAQDPTPATLTVEWSDDGVRAAASPPNGFLVRLRLADHRTYHALVHLAIVPVDTFPRRASRCASWPDRCGSDCATPPEPRCSTTSRSRSPSRPPGITST